MMMDNFIKEIEYYIDLNVKAKSILSLSELIGLCIFYGNLYSDTKKELYYEKLEEYVSNIIDILEKKTINCCLESGASGILWLFNYLNQKGLVSISENFIKSLQENISDEFKNCLKEDNWVFLRGALGCLKVIPSDENYVILIDFLEKKIEEDKFEPIFSFWYPQHTNLGVIYGVLGLLYFLNKSLNYNINKIKANRLRQKLLQFILEEYEKNGFYPAVKGGKECRMCWCYGELSLAYFLYDTGELMNNVSLQGYALEIAEATTKRTAITETGIIDSCLQHGAAGNYLLYRSLYRKTQSDIFKNSADWWLNHTKKILLQNHYKVINRHTGYLESDLSLLTGLTGIGLTLMENKKDWLDYVLLDD